MNLRSWTIGIVFAALILSALLALFGSFTSDIELTRSALDVLKVVAGGVAGALGAGIRPN